MPSGRISFTAKPPLELPLALVLFLLAGAAERLQEAIWFPFVMGLIWLLYRRPGVDYRLDRHVRISLILLAAYGVAQLSSSVSPVATLAQILRFAGYVALMLLLMQRWGHSADAGWDRIRPFLIILCLEAFLGVIQRTLTRSNEFAVGTFLNHSHYANFLVIGIPFAVTLTIVATKTMLAKSSITLISALPVLRMAGMVALLISAILLAASRSAFISMLASLVVLGAMTISRLSVHRVTASLLLLAVVVLPCWLLVTDQIAERFDKMSTIEKITADAPLPLWRNALTLYSACSWMGCGWGAYRVAARTLLPAGSASDAHSDYLQALAEFGVVGAAILTVSGAAVLRMASRRTALKSPSLAPCFANACTASLVSILLSSTVETNLYIPANAFLSLWIGGIAAGLCHQHRSVIEVPRSRSCYA